jgi:hypothetical protein
MSIRTQPQPKNQACIHRNIHTYNRVHEGYAHEVKLESVQLKFGEEVHSAVAKNAGIHTHIYTHYITECTKATHTR